MEFGEIGTFGAQVLLLPPDGLDKPMSGRSYTGEGTLADYTIP